MILLQKVPRTHYSIVGMIKDALLFGNCTYLEGNGMIKNIVFISSLFCCLIVSDYALTETKTGAKVDNLEKYVFESMDGGTHGVLQTYAGNHFTEETDFTSSDNKYTNKGGPYGASGFSGSGFTGNGFSASSARIGSDYRIYTVNAATGNNRIDWGVLNLLGLVGLAGIFGRSSRADQK